MRPFVQPLLKLTAAALPDGCATIILLYLSSSFSELKGE